MATYFNSELGKFQAILRGLLLRCENIPEAFLTIHDKYYSTAG